MASKPWQHFAAMALIGDGVLALIHPRRDALAWHVGPEPWRRLMRKLQNRPTLTRLIGAAQIAGAVAWALSQEKEPPAKD